MQLSVQQALLNAKTHEKNGQIPAAKQLYLSILEKFPNNKPAQLGLAALDQLKPTNATPAQDQINALIALFHQGRFKDVIEQAAALAKQYPQMVLLHNIMGAAYASMGQFDGTIECSQRALQVDPASIEAHNNLGGALKQKGDFASAVKSYHNALRIDPENAELHNNLGTSLKETGDIAAAEQSYQKALEIAPDNLKYIMSICDFYEKTNDIAGLSDIISKSKNHPSASNSNFLYYCAILDFRQKEFESAKAYLDRINPDELIPKGASAFYVLKGKVSDKLGLYDDAFAAFSHMNKQVAESDACKQIDPDKYFNRISSFLKELKEAPSFSPAVDSTKADPTNTPCFLIGFPRSGTTLLDTILRSHSKVIVVEEQPMVSSVQHALGSASGIAEFESFTPEKKSALQANYFGELNKHIDVELSNEVCIDKLPLNALDAPLIRNVFPEAKFILAIRHPFDSILSCYMQNFKLNSSMANMLDLKRIVEFYCITMETWWLSQKRYNIDFHMIRYEDVVTDMPNQIEKLLQFLGLEWEASITDYQKTALERGKINTPSYSQVVQPLYKDASYRWKNYQKYFDEYEPQIRPWIERFGYE